MAEGELGCWQGKAGLIEAIKATGRKAPHITYTSLGGLKADGTRQIFEGNVHNAIDAEERHAKEAAKRR